MTFHMDIIRECLASWVQLRICQLLMRQPKPMSENQMSRLLDIPLTTLHRSLKSLGKTRLIKAHRVGTSSYWTLDDRSYLYATLKPILEGLNALTPPLNFLKEMILSQLRIPKGYRLILFGSTIEGTDTSSSDIDLCVVYPDSLVGPDARFQGDLERLQESCLDKFGKSLNPLFVKDSILAKNPKKALYVNILQGTEIRP